MQFHLRTLMIVLAIGPPVLAAENGPDVRAERRIGDKNVHVIWYAEQWGKFAAGFGDRNWRSVLCVEVLDKGAQKPRRVWQRCVLGKQGFPEVGSIKLSDAHEGRFMMAYSDLHYFKRITACVISLDGEVSPLPAEMRVGPKINDPNWEDSPILELPPLYGGHATMEIAAFWKKEIGMELLVDKHQILLTSAARSDTGWRIDAEIINPYDQIERVLPGGEKLMYRNPRPLKRFSVRLDEECKSYRIDDVK